MYITLQYTNNLGSPIQLVTPVDCINKRIALSKVIYTVSWFNISNNSVSNNNSVNNTTIPSGYYNVSLLQTAVQNIDSSFTLTQNQANGTVSLRCANSITLGFANLLGFSVNTFSPNVTYTGSLPKLMNRVINITLNEINTTHNLFNSTQSNILYSMINKGNMYGDTVEYEVIKPEFKKLSDRYLNQLTVNMTDENGNAFNTQNIFALFVLKIE